MEMMRAAATPGEQEEKTAFAYVAQIRGWTTSGPNLGCSTTRTNEAAAGAAWVEISPVATARGHLDM